MVFQPECKEGLHFGSGDFTFEDVAARLIPLKQAKVDPVGSVAAVRMGQLHPRDAQCCVDVCNSRITTRTRTASREINVGQMSTSSLVLFKP
jgi:hypothetical protein